MHICIDSSTFVFGLRGIDPAATRVLEPVGDELNLVIPRLIARKITRNLSTSEQVKQFYQLFQNYSFARIIDEPVLPTLVTNYTASLEGKQSNHYLTRVQLVSTDWAVQPAFAGHESGLLI